MWSKEWPVRLISIYAFIPTKLCNSLTEVVEDRVIAVVVEEVVDDVIERVDALVVVHGCLDQ